MNLSQTLTAIQDELIAKIRAITNRPDDWLPHLVFVEEVGEDKNGVGTQVYNKYYLVDFNADGSCTLRNTSTDANEDDADRQLSEINIDWLVIVWNRYEELAIEQGIIPPSTPACVEYKQGDLVCLNESAIELVRKNFGDAPAEYRKAMFLIVCDSDQNSNIVKVQDIREDDIQEFSAENLRLLLPKDERCFLTTPTTSNKIMEVTNHNKAEGTNNDLLASG